jgi:CO/xanthine dehydrogenase Mo-binding subunit
MTEDGIGVPLRRREDRRFLTGRGRYVHDIVRPQQLHAVFLRSPHAHAVFGLKSQVSDFVPAHVEVIAAINATDATPFPDLLRAWCRALPSSDP